MAMKATWSWAAPMAMKVTLQLDETGTVVDQETFHNPSKSSCGVVWCVCDEDLRLTLTSANKDLGLVLTSGDEDDFGLGWTSRDWDNLGLGLSSGNEDDLELGWTSRDEDDLELDETNRDGRQGNIS